MAVLRRRALFVPLLIVVSLLASTGGASAAEGGDVLPYGGAVDLGSTEGQTLATRIVGIAPTSSGAGYWQVSGEGGIFSFGDARFLGSTGGQRLNRPIVGMAATASGDGYWLVADDGGIFSFGDAAFLGSTGGQRLVDPIVAMAPSPGEEPGYWLVAADGGLFTFGAAPFAGSAAQTCKIGPVVGIAARPGEGYWLATSEVVPTPTGAGAHPLTVLSLLSGDLATELRHRQACQGRAAASAGRLSLPLREGIRTTAYGPRTHPIYGIPQLHTGIDLARGDGITRAAADGFVVKVRDLHGYGITTIVDHGDGLSTLVAHQRTTSVVVGQRVTRGQAIGQMGSTGFSTGPHVHFEVRVHGVATNPDPWL